MISPRLLNRFRSLRLSLPGRVAPQQGGHSHRARGRSLEFSEHRDYVPGDDLRHLDWNVYARLERFVIKVFQAELEQPVHLLFDASASMEGDKLATANGLAASLAFIALAAGDRAGLASLAPNLPFHPAVRGLGQWGRLVKFLEEQKARGEARLSVSLRLFGLRNTRPGQVIVLSDFLEPDAGLEGLNYLLYQKHHLTLVQILSDQDVDPQVDGDLRLTDMEQPAHRDVTVDGRIRGFYKTCLAQHNAKLKDWCRRHGCFFFSVEAPSGFASQGSPDELLERLVTRDLCQAGLLR